MKYLQILFFIAFSIVAYGQNNEKDSLIQELMIAQGSMDVFETVIDNMIEIQRNQNLNIDDQFWNNFSKKMKNNGGKKLIDLIIPIYAKYFNEDQIRDIILFYKSDTGKYFVSKQSEITTESMTIGAVWGEEIAQEIVQELENSNEIKYTNTFEGCEVFHEGEFETNHPDYGVTKIIRTENIQIEINNDVEYKFNLEWLSSCRYKTTPMDETSKGEVIINIYEMSSDSYKYISLYTPTKTYFTGDVLKIE